MKKTVKKQRVRKPNINQIDKVAIYLAGKVAIALYCGIKFEYATIMPDEIYLCKVSGLKVLAENQFKGGISEKDEGKYNDELMVLVAGEVAVSKLAEKQFRVRLHHYLHPEFRKMYDLSRIAISENFAVIDALMKYMVVRVTDLLDNDEFLWIICLKIAETLKEKKTLTYSECQTIYWHAILKSNKLEPIELKMAV